MSNKLDKTVRVGRITGCHGLRGELKVRLHDTGSGTQLPPWATKGNSLELIPPVKVTITPLKTAPLPKTVQVESARWQKEMLLLKLDGYPDRTTAEPLIGSTLVAVLADLPEPETDQFWVNDLIGLTVIDVSTRESRGTVQDVLSSGGSEFLEIQLSGSLDTIVIPFIDRFFPAVSLPERTVTIDFPGDLRDLSA